MPASNLFSFTGGREGRGREGGRREGGRSVKIPMKEDDKRRDDWMMQEMMVEIWLCESMRE